jgi:hypothetical protein
MSLDLKQVTTMSSTRLWLCAKSVLRLTPTLKRQASSLVFLAFCACLRTQSTFSNRIDKARWLQHIHFFLKLVVEEGRLDIHVVDLPPRTCSQGQQEPQCGPREQRILLSRSRAPACIPSPYEIFVPNYQPNILATPFFPFPSDSVVFLPQFYLARSSQTRTSPTVGPLSRALRSTRCSKWLSRRHGGREGGRGEHCASHRRAHRLQKRVWECLYIYIYI